MLCWQVGGGEAKIGRIRCGTDRRKGQELAYQRYKPAKSGGAWAMGRANGAEIAQMGRVGEQR